MTTYIRAKAITEDDDGEGSGATLHAIEYTDKLGVARQVYPDGIYVGTGGDMDLIMLNDSSAVEFKNAISGTVYPFAFKALHTDSTIANAVALSTGVNVVTRP